MVKQQFYSSVGNALDLTLTLETYFDIPYPRDKRKIPKTEVFMKIICCLYQVLVNLVHPECKIT